MCERELPRKFSRPATGSVLYSSWNGVLQFRNYRSLRKEAFDVYAGRAEDSS
jgi:hypothetical protein